MTKIADDVVQTVIKLLDQHKGKLWDSYYWELQDSGITLFIKLNLFDHPSKKQLQLIRNTLIGILHSRLPQHQQWYSWVACIYYKEKQIDAIMGGIGDYVV